MHTAALWLAGWLAGSLAGWLGWREITQCPFTVPLERLETTQPSSF